MSAAGPNAAIVAAAMVACVLAFACTVDIPDVTCTPGVGAPPQKACGEGRIDCNCRADDGCEVDSRSDRKNCGACGHDCGGGECVGGTCQPVILATSNREPGALALSAGRVFVAAEGALLRFDSTLAAMPTVMATNAEPAFAVDAHHLYGVTTIGGETALRRVLLEGGPFETLSPAGPVGAVALDTEAVYVAANTDVGEIQRVPKSGGSATSLGTFGDHLLGLAVDDTNVFFFRGIGTGFLDRMTKSGADVERLVDGPSIADMAIDEAYVYYALRGEGPHRVDKSSGFDMLLDAAPGVRTIAVDASFVYFTTEEGDVVRISKSKGARSVIATGQTGTNDLAVDDQALYWTRTTDGGGTLVRLVK